MSRDEAGKFGVEAWVDLETQEYYMYLATDNKPNKLQEPEMEKVGSGIGVEGYEQLVLADRVKRGWLPKGPPAEGKV